MVDAEIGPLDAAEEAFDMVRVDTALGLVFLVAVEQAPFLQTSRSS